MPDGDAETDDAPTTAALQLGAVLALKLHDRRRVGGRAAALGHAGCLRALHEHDGAAALGFVPEICVTKDSSDVMEVWKLLPEFSRVLVYMRSLAAPQQGQKPCSHVRSGVRASILYSFNPYVNRLGARKVLC